MSKRHRFTALVSMRATVLALAATVALLTMAVACDTPAEHDSDPEQESPPEQESTREPQTDAEKLATRIVETHGGTHWESIQTMAFTFVVADGEERRFEAHHEWDVQAGTDRVKWRDDEDRLWDVLVDIETASAQQAHIDDEPLEGAELDDAGEQGYTRWINDTYWLLMPIKLFDPGVTLRLEEGLREDESPEDAKPGLATLELTFEDVGLTPGDRYRVRVDMETYEIDSWQMDLEGRDELIDVDWGGYEQLGDLYLPLERTWRDRDQRLFFEDVAVD